MTLDDILKQFTANEKLSPAYIRHAQKWFVPLAQELALHHDHANRPIFIGVNGSQGSGKSTLSNLLVSLLACKHGKRAVCISIDDYYLTKEKRLALASKVHPLLKTRGVPGTHDVELMALTIDDLLLQRESRLPIFDKSIDDVKPPSQWREIKQHYDIVILEGWCVGINSQTKDKLISPTNTMEKEKDAVSAWRNYVNDSLQAYYEPIFSRIDILVMLRAPSFDCVFKWRCEQEHKLIEHLHSSGLPSNQTMTDSQIYDFIQLYQRLTEHALETLPSRAHYVFELDANRGITTCQTQ